MATFGQYVHSVYPGDSRKAQLRPGSDKRGIPFLSKDRVNRVLIYAGSFNPPHVGHLSALRHAFESSPDLNIVAGIVIPLPVEHIEGKNYWSGRYLVLSGKQRSELWKRDGRFPAWAFAPSYKSLQLTEEIANAAKKDGYEILYIELGGPDIWNFRSPYRHVCGRHTENLISDASRSAPFLSPDGVPQPVNGYTTWQRLELDLQPGAEQLQRTKRPFQTFESPRLVASVVGAVSAKEVEFPDLSPSDNSEDPMSERSSTASSTTVTEDSTSNSSIENLDECHQPTEAVGYEKENVIWECFEQCTEYHRCCNLGPRLRLACKKTRDVGLLGSVTNEISSTALYRTITQSTGKDRLKQLQNQVLSADLFCKFLKQNDFDRTVKRHQRQ